MSNRAQRGASLPSMAQAQAVVSRSMEGQREGGLSNARPRFGGSLSSIPARPVVQRECLDCREDDAKKVRREVDEDSDAAADDADRDVEPDSSEEDTEVAPRLEVGPVQDPFEREADTIASRVMSGVPAKENEKTGSPRVSRKQEGGSRSDARGIRQIEASRATLTSKGLPLSTPTREFFEARMGRDLSAVRIHKDDQSHELTRSIRARAFTYANHIWLGSSETDAPTYTMAHELVHVLQQTRPTKESADSIDVQSGRPGVQRKNLKSFWLPIRASNARAAHAAMHDKAVAAIARKNRGLIEEAPIPGASKRGVAPGLRGFADLFQANTTVGVKERLNPQAGASLVEDFLVSGWTMADFHKTRRFRKKFDHDKKREPKIAEDGTVDVTNAPSSILIGDVKPGHNPDERAKGTKQVDNYVKGIKRVRAAVKGSKRTGGSWSPSVDRLTEQIQPQSGSLRLEPKQRPRNIKLRVNGKDQSPTTRGGKRLRIKGRWLLVKDPKNAGVWTYVMAPYASSLKKLFAREKRFKKFGTIDRFAKKGGELQRDVITPLTKPIVKPRPLPKRSIAKLNRVQSDHPIVRRKAGGARSAKPIRDSFNLKEWNRIRVGKKRVRGKRSVESRLESKVPERKRAILRYQAHVLDALKDSKDSLAIKPKTPLNVDSLRKAQLRKAAPQLDRLSFWFSKKAYFVGSLRKAFGGVFVRVANLFQKVKGRVKEIFSKAGGKPKGGKLKKAAMRVGFSVLKQVGGIVMRKTFASLARCVSLGFRRTMKPYVEGAGISALEAKADDAQQLAQKLQKDTLDKIEPAVEKFVGEFKTELSELVNNVKLVAKFVGIAKDIINGARAAVCVIGGIKTAGVACVAAGVDWFLGLFGASPTEALAGRVLNSCWARKKVAKKLEGTEFVKNLPKTISTKIINLVRGKLPAKARSLLCDPKEVKVPVLVKPGEFECKSGGSGSGDGTGSGGSRGRKGGTGGQKGSKTGTTVKAGSGGIGSDQDGSSSTSKKSKKQGSGAGGQSRKKTRSSGTTKPPKKPKRSRRKKERILKTAKTARPPNWKGTTSIVTIRIRSGISRTNPPKENSPKTVVIDITAAGRTYRKIEAKIIFQKIIPNYANTGKSVAAFKFREVVHLKQTYIDGSDSKRWRIVDLPRRMNDVYPGWLE